MPFKKGGGGRPQSYDPNTGEYGNGLSYISFKPWTPPRKTKWIVLKEQTEQDAALKGDPFLLDIVKAINKSLRKEIQGVSRYYQDSISKKTRELDIETKHFIIEVKSGSAKHSFSQFQSLSNFAKERGKQFVIFAPNMREGIRNEAGRKGYRVFDKIDKLINAMKEVIYENSHSSHKNRH